MNIDWKRLLFVGFSILSGVIVGIKGQPYIHNNDQAVNIIVTVFSILAGFLIAIMTIIGEPGVLAGRSWRYHEKNRKNVFARLIRQKWMFYLYIITLGLIFIASLAAKSYPEFVKYIEMVYLGGATVAFILSLGLPSALLRIQLERHDAVLDAKRKPAASNPPVAANAK